MMRILLVRSVPLDRDSRSSKMVAAYRACENPVTALIWTRGEAAGEDRDVRACTAPGGYGRKLRGLLARVRWFLFIARYMLFNRRSYDVVHAVDLDTAILAVPLGRLLRKRIVYDAFDQAAAMFRPGLLATVLAVIERRLLRCSDIAVFPDRARLEQYGLTDRAVNCVIIGNIPDIVAPSPPKPDVSSGRLRIAYVGTLEGVHRGLEYIPEICAGMADDIEFVVAGLGSLSEFFEKSAAGLDNLWFRGQVRYADALRLMQSADCIYGSYLLTTPAHRFAAPNKAYEHLALGRPLITNSGTPVADLVEKFDSGYIFDGSREGLFELIRRLDRKGCRQRGDRALQAWHDHFASIRHEQLADFFRQLKRLTPR